MADEGVDFGPILSAASRESQTPLPAAAEANATKEDEDLFSKGLRKPLLTTAKILLFFGLFVFCSIVIVRVWHLLFPNRGWLTEPQLKTIDSIWQSGLLVAVGGVSKDAVLKSLGINKKTS